MRPDPMTSMGDIEHLKKRLLHFCINTKQLICANSLLLVFLDHFEKVAYLVSQSRPCINRHIRD